MTGGPSQVGRPAAFRFRISSAVDSFFFVFARLVERIFVFSFFRVEEIETRGRALKVQPEEMVFAQTQYRIKVLFCQGPQRVILGSGASRMAMRFASAIENGKA